jgi:hypothetical protein
MSYTAKLTTGCAGGPQVVESSSQANFTELDGGEQDVFGKATAVQAK